MSTSLLVATKKVRVPHLGGISVSYYLPKPLKGSKPTVVFINGYGSSATQWRAQFNNEELTEAVNLLVLEPLGHGNTRTLSPSYTLWDSAYAFIQTFDALGVGKAIIVGGSMGGWIAARVALYAPERVLGLVLIGSALSDPTPPEEGKLNPATFLIQNVIDATAAPNANFVIPEQFAKQMADIALGKSADAQVVTDFVAARTAAYSGDDGRLRLKHATIAAVDKDSLRFRLAQIVAPTLWIVGSEDPVVDRELVARDAEAVGKTAAETRVEVIEGAPHSPNYSHADVVNGLLLEWARKHGGKKDARALREAVGTVDI